MQQMLELMMLLLLRRMESLLQQRRVLLLLLIQSIQTQLIQEPRLVSKRLGADLEVTLLILGLEMQPLTVGLILTLLSSLPTEQMLPSPHFRASRKSHLIPVTDATITVSMTTH